MGKIKESNLHPDLIAKIGSGGGSSDYLAEMLGTPVDPITSPTAFGKINKQDGQLSQLDQKIEEVKQSVSSGKQTIASAITDKGVQTEASDTFQTMADNISSIGSTVSLPTGNATASDVLSGKTFSCAEGIGLIGTMTDNGAVSRTLSTKTASYTVPEGFHNGSGRVTLNITNLTASNIKKGVTIAGVTGTY